MIFKNLLLAAALFCSTTPADSGIRWESWSAKVFDQARKQNRFIILDLEAVWCHWCHVMDEKTYRDPGVVRKISDRFIAIKVDQDARPDISRRYEEYGWPATIFFDPSGKEIVKRSGNIPPAEMLQLLEEIADKGLVEKENKEQLKVDSVPVLSTTLQAELDENHRSSFDPKLAGWGRVHKFLFGDTEEYALTKAFWGDASEKKRVQRTLSAATALIDPVWGGAYQYSVENWKEPHFEKIAESQAKNLHLYSLGYSLFRKPEYLSAAQAVYRYLTEHLRSPEGAFYTSQDADVVHGKHSAGYFKLSDRERRKQGVPAVDRHVYARENGWFISALCGFFAASKDPEVLDTAVRAARWVEQNRGISGGGFRHDERDSAGPYLGDSLEMGNGFLSLYEATLDDSWLQKAKLTSEFIRKTFSNRESDLLVGFATSSTSLMAGMAQDLNRDENIRAARFFNRLAQYTDKATLRKSAEQALRYLVSPSVATDGPAGGILLVAQELASEPVRIEMTGPARDPMKQKQFAEVRALPLTYKTVSLEAAPNTSPNTLPNTLQVQPVLRLCRGESCSAPFSETGEILRQKMEKFLRGLK